MKGYKQVVGGFYLYGVLIPNKWPPSTKAKELPTRTTVRNHVQRAAPRILFGARGQRRYYMLCVNLVNKQLDDLTSPRNLFRNLRLRLIMNRVESLRVHV